MVMPHSIKNLRTDACDISQQLVSDHRMASHRLLFRGVEASGLVEDRQGDTRLSDVVQRCRQSKSRHIRAGEPSVQGETDCHSRDQQAMLERSFMIAAHVVEPRSQPILGDAIDDLRRGVFGV